MCVVHVYDACIKKKHILGIPYIQVVCLENFAIWHWLGACVDLGWWITICIVCQMFFFVFRNAHRFGNSMFSSVLFCHLVFFVTALSLCVCFHPWCRYPYCTLLLGPSSLSTILLPFCIPCYACKNKSKNCKYQDCPFLVLYLFLSVSKHACVHNLIVSFFFVHP